MMQVWSEPPPGGRPSDAETDQTLRRAGPHTIEIVDAERFAVRAADVFAMAISASVELRDHCVLALSGGSTPGPVFAELAKRDLPWSKVVITQVDERIAPEGSPIRNLTGQRAAFDGLPVRWLPLAVEGRVRKDIEETLQNLTDVAGDPPIVDVVHLGLGADGHTASLVPGDPVLHELDRAVAITGDYQGTRRVTFTRPMLDRARLVVWLVRGADKAAALRMLAAGDPSIPASLLEPHNSLIIADPEAAADLDPV